MNTIIALLLKEYKHHCTKHIQLLLGRLVNIMLISTSNTLNLHCYIFFNRIHPSAWTVHYSGIDKADKYWSSEFKLYIYKMTIFASMLFPFNYYLLQTV
jgi:hypothetical protein